MLLTQLQNKTKQKLILLCELCSEMLLHYLLSSSKIDAFVVAGESVRPAVGGT